LSLLREDAERLLTDPRFVNIPFVYDRMFHTIIAANILGNQSTEAGRYEIAKEAFDVSARLMAVAGL